MVRNNILWEIFACQRHVHQTVAKAKRVQSAKDLLAISNGNFHMMLSYKIEQDMFQISNKKNKTQLLYQLTHLTQYC